MSRGLPKNRAASRRHRGFLDAFGALQPILVRLLYQAASLSGWRGTTGFHETRKHESKQDGALVHLDSPLADQSRTLSSCKMGHAPSRSMRRRANTFWPMDIDASPAHQELTEILAALVNGDRWLCAGAEAAYLGRVPKKTYLAFACKCGAPPSSRSGAKYRGT